jgi:hypothetical protein
MNPWFGASMGQAGLIEAAQVETGVRLLRFAHRKPATLDTSEDIMGCTLTSWQRGGRTEAGKFNLIAIRKV